MHQSKRNLLGGERGSSLVELSLTLPVLVALLLGAAEISQVVYAGIEVSDAALAGVQYGGQSTIDAADVTGIGNAAANDAPNLALGTTTASTACICSDGSGSTCQPTDCSGSNIETILTVNTQATITPIVKFPGLPGSYTVYGQAVQKVEE